MIFMNSFPLSDLPFHLKDVHDGLRDAPLDYFDYERVDAILALCQQIHKVLADSVGPYMGEWSPEEIRTWGRELRRGSNILQEIGDGLIERRRRPYELAGLFWPFIASVRLVWNHLDELGILEQELGITETE